MRVLLDTNVLLDVLLRRQPFLEPAVNVWAALETGRADGVVAAISVNNVYYVIAKTRDRAVAREAVDILLKAFPIAAVDGDILTKAFASPLVDYEDAIQAFAGERFGATHVIRRDPDGFAGGPLRVLSPTEFLEVVSTP
ncbi:MAG TPA: PIN domain-containing protein [Tepidisphaeraceae bacterium]|nr:PIN domain-containing protein [Tepidisphaeraceae bacterium]